MTLKPTHPTPAHMTGHLAGCAILLGKPYDFYITSNSYGEKLTAVTEHGWVTLRVNSAKLLTDSPVWRYALHLYYTTL